MNGLSTHRAGTEDWLAATKGMVFIYDLIPCGPSVSMPPQPLEQETQGGTIDEPNGILNGDTARA